MKIVLASGSAYRKELLFRLGIPFVCSPPDISEEKIKISLLALGTSPEKIAETISFEKGYQRAKLHSDALVISGDQLVAFENQLLGKPGTAEKALSQLALLNGKTHRLITAITLFPPASAPVSYTHLSHLKMKSLSARELEHYVSLDNPVDCAGSYKIENHGISLFESIDCDDFTAIQGIPLLWLSNYLKRSGHEFFTT